MAHYLFNMKLNGKHAKCILWTTPVGFTHYCWSIAQIEPSRFSFFVWAELAVLGQW